MKQADLMAKLKTLYEQLPRQERLAAGFVLDHPQEVAVMSMREQSRIADVPPSTMTRLAKRLGFGGYDELRDVFIATIRRQGLEYESRVPGLVAMKKTQGEDSLLRDLAGTTLAHIESLCQQDNLAAILRNRQTALRGPHHLLPRFAFFFPGRVSLSLHQQLVHR